jgi:predicted DCC family thiol-disulfide oxidoreductase YuxK
MAQRAAQAPAGIPGIHLVLYDGVCGLCNRLLQFLLRHDHRKVFRFAAHQSPFARSVLERWGEDPDDLTSFFVVADYQTPSERLLCRSDAALFVAGELGWPWRAARSIRFVPKAIRDLAYDAIARSRYRLFGRSERCLLPSPEVASRFLDRGGGS